MDNQNPSNALTIAFGIIGIISLFVSLIALAIMLYDRKKEGNQGKPLLKTFLFTSFSVFLYIISFIVLVFTSFCPKKIENCISRKWENETICLIPLLTYIILVISIFYIYKVDNLWHIVFVFGIYVVFSLRYMITIKKCCPANCEGQKVINGLTSYKKGTKCRT